MTESEIPRRVILGAAWSAPVIAAVASAPAAAASTTPPDLYCTTNDPDVEDVKTLGTAFVITPRAGAQNAIDVTIRQEGFSQIHVNLVRQGKNPGDNQELYTPGVPFVITLPRPFDLARDWQQVKTIHNENCVVVA